MYPCLSYSLVFLPRRTRRNRLRLVPIKEAGGVMVRFWLGFMVAAVIGMTGMMVQKVTYERNKMEMFEALHKENHQNRIEIRKLWKDNNWLRKVGNRK
jgi:predicted alpha/beta hydrolase